MPEELQGPRDCAPEAPRHRQGLGTGAGGGSPRLREQMHQKHTGKAGFKAALLQPPGDGTSAGALSSLPNLSAPTPSLSPEELLGVGWEATEFLKRC